MGMECLFGGARHDSAQSTGVRQAKDTKPDRGERAVVRKDRSTEARRKN